MFIKFFKSSFFSQYLTIGIIGIALWARAFAEPPDMPLPHGPVPLYDLVYQMFHTIPLLSVILGFLLVLGETYWLTEILNRHDLVLKNSSLSALIFLVLMSFTPDQLTLNPVNLSVLFLIIILHHLLISYNKPEHLDRIYAAGFFTATAALFYFPFLFWFGFILISFILFRSGNWRQWVGSFIGLATPFIFLSVYYLWFDQLEIRIKDYLTVIRQIMEFPNPFHADFWILGGFTLILTIFGLSKIWMGPTEKTAEVRAKISIMLWMIPFTAFSFGFSGTLAIYHPALAMPALTFILTTALTGMKKTRFVESMLLIYFLAILANNLFSHYLLNS